MLSLVSVAKAGISLQGTSITGQTTEKQFKQELKGAHPQGSSLTGQTTEKQPAQ